MRQQITSTVNIENDDRKKIEEILKSNGIMFEYGKYLIHEM